MEWSFNKGSTLFDLLLYRSRYISLSNTNQVNQVNFFKRETSLCSILGLCCSNYLFILCHIQVSFLHLRTMTFLQNKNLVLDFCNYFNRAVYILWNPTKSPANNVLRCTLFKTNNLIFGLVWQFRLCEFLAHIIF